MQSMTPLKLTLGFVAILTLLITFAMQRIPVPPDPIVMTTAFDTAWIDVIKPLALTKANKEQQIRVIDMIRSSSTESIPVATERVAPSIVPPVVLVRDEDKPAMGRRRQQGDICGRWGMHKVMHNGGKSWRCRKSPVMRKYAPRSTR